MSSKSQKSSSVGPDLGLVRTRGSPVPLNPQPPSYAVKAEGEEFELLPAMTKEKVTHKQITVDDPGKHDASNVAAPLYRKVTISFNVTQEDFDLLQDGHIGIHVNFRDSSINTVREPWECPHCNGENTPDTMYCGECSEFVEYGERL